MKICVSLLQGGDIATWELLNQGRVVEDEDMRHQKIKRLF